MLTVYKRSWSGDITMVLDSRWEIGKMEGAKKTEKLNRAVHTH